MMVTVRLGYCSAAAASVACVVMSPRPISAAATIRKPSCNRPGMRSSLHSNFFGSSDFCGSLHVRNYRQQEIWLLARGEMQRVAGGKDVRRPVIGIDVQERADALHRIGRVWRGGIAAVDFVVLVAPVEGAPKTFRP